MLSKIEISHKTIIFTVVFLASLWILLQIVDIIYLVFIAFIVMTALRPLVDGLERFRVPRFLGILVVYGGILGFFGVSFAGSIPTLVHQTARLIQLVPSVVEKLLPYWNIDAGAITQQIAPIGENVFKVTLGIFSNIFTLFTVLVFTFYFLLERKNARNYASAVAGKEVGDRIFYVLTQIEERIGAWVRGQLLLMTVVGLLVYIGLTLLRVEFALPLAILAGLLELVPMIGPLASGTVAVLVALATSPLLAVSVAALYFIIQQLENTLIVPYIIHKSVGLSPVITIIALMIGSRFAGLTGAVLAVPLVLVIQTLLTVFVEADSQPTINAKNPSAARAGKDQ